MAANGYLLFIGGHFMKVHIGIYHFPQIEKQGMGINQARL